MLNRKRVILSTVALIMVGFLLYLGCSEKSTTEPDTCSNLIIVTNGSGSVLHTPENECYESGTQVYLTAIPDEGNLFDKWTGNVTFTDDAEYDSIIVVTFGTEDVTLIANFETGYSLSVFINTPYSGDVVVYPDQEYYPAGDSVVLTAVSFSGFQFSHWIYESVNYTSNPVQLTFGAANEEITVNFATLEGETDCGDDYDDHYNGGCNSTPPVFQSIADGQIYFGTSGTFLYDFQTHRDTDWFQYSTSHSSELVFKGVAEFPLLLFIIDGTLGCDYLEVVEVDSSISIGDTVTVTANVLPGTYWMWVGPIVYEGWSCPRDYTIWFSTNPAAVTDTRSPGKISKSVLSNKHIQD